MNRRLLLATLAVAVLAVTAGCIGQFGVGISEDDLAEPAEYDWETEEDVEIELQEGGLLGGSEYTVVYDVNQTELTLSLPGFTRSRAVDVRSVQFRHPNGTIVGHEEIEVDQSARETRIVLPDEEGQFAYTGDRRSQRMEVPALDDGSYSATLPPGYRVGDFLLSDVTPRNYESETTDGVTRITWAEIDEGDRILVNFYSERGWYLFYGLVAVLSVAAVGAYVYFNREIEAIREWREEQGLDLDRDEDDDDEQPPPGMG